MIYMWFTGRNYYKLAVEKDRESICKVVVVSVLLVPSCYEKSRTSCYHVVITLLQG
jgi:hypothetical protein